MTATTLTSPLTSPSRLRPRTILIAPRPGHPAASLAAARLADDLSTDGFTVLTDSPAFSFSDALSRPDLPELLPDLSIPDLVIALGGDGTVLHWISRTAPLGIPVLGINFGHFGFYCALSSDAADLDRLRDALRRSGLAVHQRSRLALRLADAPSETILALNEASFVSAAPGRAVRLAVDLDADPFTTLTGDGLVVASPSGSTAYSLSAGGPILSPFIDALVATPIAPHSHAPRPLVLPASSTLSVTATDGRPVLILVDGSERATLSPGHSAHITGAASPALLATLPDPAPLEVLWARHLRSAFGYPAPDPALSPTDYPPQPSPADATAAERSPSLLTT